MFTGIIEKIGKVKSLTKNNENLEIEVESDLSPELKVDQSVSHNGVCLTVVKLNDTSYFVTAIAETLRKTNLGSLQIGDTVNLERCMPANGRFDGHIVQGHVDQLAQCKKKLEEGGSWLFDFEFDSGLGNITVEKGSICINGVSLTCFNSSPGKFSVAIIPYTYEHTNFYQINIGDYVNLEFDIVGKYIQAISKNQL
ncbi:MAG: riboflavin synthase [Cyclobacteriaceae bacterium]|nr:riboflavin synthase [Cyclobacteriaceae bacterium]MCH8515950.1 riboflavin synthase [Cyclobacteriaceae bacterium]